MLVSDQIPKTKDLKLEAAPVVRSQVKKQGPNKRQRLIAATQIENPATGHKWAVTASAKNLCIKCERCTLFAQQVDPEPTVLFVLSHPCRHIPAQPSPGTGSHPSHKIVNLGHLWRCSRCHANYSVRVQAKGRLTKVCTGPPKKAKGVSSSRGSVFPSPSAGFAALFSGKVSGASVPTSAVPGAQNAVMDPDASVVRRNVSHMQIILGEHLPSDLAPVAQVEQDARKEISSRAEVESFVDSGVNPVLCTADASARVSQPLECSSSSKPSLNWLSVPRSSAKAKPKAKPKPKSSGPSPSVLSFFKKPAAASPSHG